MQTGGIGVMWPTFSNTQLNPWFLPDIVSWGGKTLVSYNPIRWHSAQKVGKVVSVLWILSNIQVFGYVWALDNQVDACPQSFCVC